VLDLVVGLLGRLAAEIRIRARAQALRELTADVKLDGRLAGAELLDVRVHRDELDLRDAGLDHAVDRIQASPSDTDDADDGEVRGRLRSRRTVDPRRRLGHARGGSGLVAALGDGRRR
jgi:hypothetical protein